MLERADSLPCTPGTCFLEFGSFSAASGLVRRFSHDIAAQARVSRCH